MAGYIEKARDHVLRMAGKDTTSTNLAIARDVVESAIDLLNQRFHYGFLEEEKIVSFAGGSTNHTVDMPIDFATMRQDGFGEYDSTNERIKVPWQKKTQDWFNRNYNSFSSLLVSGAGQTRIWFFRDSDSGGRVQVRVHPAPDSALTALAQYYAKLTTANIERLPTHMVLVYGAVTQMPYWFDSAITEKNEKLFERSIADLKNMRRAVETGIVPMPDQRIINHNRTGWSIK